MVTCPYRLLFFIVLVINTYILVHWLHFVALNGFLFLFCLKKKEEEDAQSDEPILNIQPVFSGQLTIQHTFP